MKKFLAILAILLLFGSAIAFAQTEAAVGTEAKVAIEAKVKRPIIKPIKHIFLHGTGIAVNASDATDVSHAKAIISGVRVINKVCLQAAREAGEDKEKCIETKTVGLLGLDEKRYRLSNVTVSHDSVTADILLTENVAVRADVVSETVGTISVKRIEKPGRDIWSGQIVFSSGTTYNVYFLGVQREFTKTEVKEGLGDFCKKHPRERSCRHLNLCKNNPEHPNCTEVKEKFCTFNAGDIRCRGYLKKLCSEKPESVFCKKITVAGKAVITINPLKVKIREEAEATAETSAEAGSKAESESKAGTEAKTETTAGATVGVETGKATVNVQTGIKATGKGGE